MRSLVFRIFFFTGVILPATSLLFSCHQGSSTVPGEWEVSPGSTSGSLSLSQGKETKKIIVEGRDGSSGYYYVTNEGVQHLTALKNNVRKEGKRYLTYATTDGREARLTVIPRDSGIIQTVLTVTPAQGVLKTGMSLTAHPGERFYGLMERTVDGDQKLSWQPGTPAGLDVRGKKITMKVFPTLGIYEPFFVSSEGYGLFIHGTQPGSYDMAATDTALVDLCFDDTTLTASFLAGPSMMDVIRRLPLLTGSSFLPPKWAFRPLRWRDEHVNLKKYYDGTPVRSPYNSQVTEDILMARAYGIPVGTYWVDRPWATGYHGYGSLRWDPERFPHAGKMIKWINNQNMHFMVWIAPWACDSLLEEAAAKGFLLPAPRMQEGHSRYPNPWLIDFYNPSAGEWWKEVLKERLIRSGIAGFKMDRSEELIRKIDTCTLPGGQTVHHVHNDYPRLYLKAAHEALHELRGDDFLPMPRAGYTGSQQYGVFWGGDIAAGEYGLRTALIAVQRCSFMNFPLWGSDIGGYWQNPLSHINMARWLAFGAFTPIMEVGPLDNRAPWDMPYQPHYDTTLIAIYRTYSIIHDTLKEYSYAMAEKAARQGIPIVRPLTLLFPQDKKAAEHWDEYMYGDNLLVGIIWRDNQRSFDMYLPEGRWTDYWTGKEYTGGKTVTVDCPEYKIPVFLTGENRPTLPDPVKLYRESLDRARQVPDLAKLQDKEFRAR